jgi:hypothetical protein
VDAELVDYKTEFFFWWRLRVKTNC